MALLRLRKAFFLHTVGKSELLIIIGFLSFNPAKGGFKCCHNNSY